MTRSIALLVFFAIISTTILAQESPSARKYFSGLREFSDGPLPDLWEGCFEVQGNYLEKKASVPAADWKNPRPNTLNQRAGRIT